jgi:hypothetical protein
MRREQLWNSPFLRAADPQGRPAEVTIESAAAETLRDSRGERTKLVVRFRNRQKALVCNQVNFDSIVNVTGVDDSDGWPGHAITLYPTTTTLGNKAVPCIRVREQSKQRCEFRPPQKHWKIFRSDQSRRDGHTRCGCP